MGIRHESAIKYMPDLTRAELWFQHYVLGEGLKYRGLLARTHPEAYNVLCSAYCNEEATELELQEVLDRVAEVVNLEIIKG